MHLTKEELWHRRLGHPSPDRLNQLIQSDLVEGLDAKVMPKPHNSKSTRHAYPRQHKPTSTPFSHIHCDTCEIRTEFPIDETGTQRLSGYSRIRHVIIFVDNHSRMWWTKQLEHRSEAAAAFLEFYKFAKTETGAEMKVLQTDGAKELTLGGIRSHCEEHGIQILYTSKHSPEQNGVAERAWRTAANTTRTLLIQSGLPSYFWPFAFNVAVRIHNFTPSTPIGGDIPIVRWKRDPAWKPSLLEFRTFGCLAFVHSLKHERVDKMSPRSRKCIFLGFAPQQPAWLFYDPEQDKLLITKDASFDETRFPAEEDPTNFSSAAAAPADHLVELPAEAQPSPSTHLRQAIAGTTG